MKLTEDQIAFVKQSINDGADISEVQSALSSKFNIHLTYIDTRLLIDDLELELHAGNDEQHADIPTISSENIEDEDCSKVRVDVDSVVRPGAMLNGSVVFSDGKKASWSIDNFGRLSIKPEMQGYRPTESDLVEFQKIIQEKI